MKRILFLLAVVFIISGCKNKGTFTINGAINGDTEKYIKISIVDVDTPLLLDSAKINREGSFRFKIKASVPDFYQLGFSSTNFITLLAEPGEKVILVFEDKNLFERYSVNGSVGTEKLQILDLALNETKRKLDSLNIVYAKASEEPVSDVEDALMIEEFNKVIKEQRMKNIEFIINNLSSLASIKALYQRIDSETYVLYEPNDLQFLKIVSDSLTHFYPDSKHVKALTRDLEKEMNQMYLNQIVQITKDIPETKLDPDLKNVDGIRIALSSLRGKYVLLTFWSFQSRECIEENLLFKEYYRLYSKKGFEIYQINLDESESDWKSAVKFDELPWINTREDDPSNPKNAVLFYVKHLPTNYLFDKEGNIIASNLHGRSLKLKLEQLYNN